VRQACVAYARIGWTRVPEPLRLEWMTGCERDGVCLRWPTPSAHRRHYHVLRGDTVCVGGMCLRGSVYFDWCPLDAFQ
jgi:hypothetical protein